MRLFFLLTSILCINTFAQNTSNNKYSLEFLAGISHYDRSKNGNIVGLEAKINISKNIYLKTSGLYDYIDYEYNNLMDVIDSNNETITNIKHEFGNVLLTVGGLVYITKSRFSPYAHMDLAIRYSHLESYLTKLKSDGNCETLSEYVEHLSKARWENFGLNFGFGVEVLILNSVAIDLRFTAFGFKHYNCDFSYFIGFVYNL